MPCASRLRAERSKVRVVGGVHVCVQRVCVAMRPADDIRKCFEDAGIDFKSPVVASCGSGVTACVIAFAGYLIGKDEIAVYDGSWSEWGSRHDTPIDSE